MPIFELECQACGSRVDRYLSSSWKSNPVCEVCGGLTERLMSRFSAPFCGPLSAKYNDPKIAGAHQEGFFATKLRNTPDGKPQQVYIDSFQKLREYSKSEGVVSGLDLPTNAEASSDKKLSSRGMPGGYN